MVVSLDEFMASRPQLRQGKEALFDEMVASRKPEDLAILVYTSGTTGPPKGAMHCHRNVVYIMQNCMHPDCRSPGTKATSGWPSCRSAMSPSGSPAATTRSRPASCSNFAESPETVLDNIREVQPTLFGAVPRVWEKILLGHHDRAEGRDPARSSWAYKAGDRRRASPWPTPASPGASPRRSQKLALPGRLLAGAEQHPPDDRARPLPLAVHRRGADRARTDPLVPRARSRHVRGLRPDRELRPRHGDAANAIKLGTVGKSVPYGEVKISPAARS